MAVRTAIVSAYRWNLAPSQPDPQDATRIQFTEFRTNVSNQGEIVNAAFNRFVQEEALIEEITPRSLARILQERVWGTSGYGDHVDVNILWEMITSYIYLPRLRNRRILQHCIEQGVRAGAFGYARDYNSDTDEYRGMRFEAVLQDPELGTVINEDSGGLLVAPGRAAEEKLKEQEKETQGGTSNKQPTEGRGTENGTQGEGTGAEGPRPPEPEPPIPHRIRASKTVKGDLSLDDFSKLRNDIIRVLQDGGGRLLLPSPSRPASRTASTKA